MDANVKCLIINGIQYVPKTEIEAEAVRLDGMQYVIIRTYSSGVFAGYLKKKDGLEVELVNARRIWYWEGAASLSQLAMEGTSKPQSCKFPCEVLSVILQWSEIIPCTEKARQSIKEVKVWKE